MKNIIYIHCDNDVTNEENHETFTFFIDKLSIKKTIRSSTSTFPSFLC